jgi:alkanesulfonate monooxygenase SsuD/methylene tetrahydromethanopterin reductase-like flavin-dependent oxidoreductase (luciferase family)
VERFRRKAARVRELGEAAGRSPAEITLSAIFFVQIAVDDREAKRLTDGIAARYGLSAAEAERFPLMLIGTAAQLRERLAERIRLLDLGYVVLNFRDATELTHFATEVLRALR